MKAITFALAIALAGTGAYADTHDGTSTTDKTKADKLTPSDLAVLAHLHAVSQMEINLGQLAQHNSNNHSVQDYGKQLVSDHQKLDDDVKDLAKKSDGVISRDIPANDADKEAQTSDQQMMTALKTLKGPAFDQKFLEMMMAGHQRELARLDAAMNQTSTDGLKVLLTSIRPAMQTHLDAARTLQQATPRT